jgi:8-oxo-dGTP diphosphatase
MEPNHINYWKWQGKEIRFDIYVATDFSNLMNVGQVYGLILSKDRSKVLIVREKSGTWLLPGGTVEQGETLLDTLQREVKEETNRDIAIQTVKPLFYQNAYRKNEQAEWELMRTEVRYKGIVENDFEFISDPDHGNIIEAKWIPITDLDQYLDWGETTWMMMRLLE